jgi:hypothetical protein
VHLGRMQVRVDLHHFHILELLRREYRP